MRSGAAIPVNIIVEGLWGAGKTTLSKSFCEKYNYIYLKEPLHTSDIDPLSLDSWYLEQHLQRQKSLARGRILLERSVLSSFAYAYALGHRLPDDALLVTLKESIRVFGVMIVYLRAEIDRALSDSALYSLDIRSILNEPAKRARYEEWYTKILPRDHGIVPLIIDGHTLSRRTPDELAESVWRAIDNDRIAQVNVVCLEQNEPQAPRVLVLKRSPEKGGFWQTVTGGIHRGEDLYDAARREVYEETGRGPDEYTLSWADMVYSFEGNEGYVLHEYVLSATFTHEPTIVLSTEHTECAWHTIEDARALLKFEDNRRALGQVQKKIERPPEIAQ